MRIYTTKELLITATCLTVPAIGLGYAALNLVAPWVSFSAVGLIAASAITTQINMQAYIKKRRKNNHKNIPQSIKPAFESAKKEFQKLTTRFNIKNITFAYKNDLQNKPNAAFAKSIYSAHIDTNTTLLEEYSSPEVNAVISHEFGHALAHHPYLKQLHDHLYLGFLALSGLYLYQNQDIENISTSIFVAGIVFASLPFAKAFNYNQEYQADRIACEIMGGTAPLIQVFKKIVDIEKSEEKEPLWSKIFFSRAKLHPSMEKRIKRMQNQKIAPL